jgi:SAM-dependent methyltransferase
LDGYLSLRQPAAMRARMRTHLDGCEPCWRRWNRVRWDAAAEHPLHGQLARFLGAGFRPYFDSSKALAAEWDAADPRTVREVAEFFRASTSYLYNLVIWEASGNRPRYLDAALDALHRHAVHTVLDYGCGIGSDAIALTEHGFTVTGCDYQSPSTAFMRWRAHGAIRVVEPGDAAAADALWIIDALDHLPDIEQSLGRMLTAATVVVTEDLREDREHGRQRFHHRRPYGDVLDLFGRYGLAPTTPAAARSAVLVWTKFG